MIEFINDLTIVVVMSSEYDTLCYTMLHAASLFCTTHSYTGGTTLTATVTQIRKTTV